MDAKKATQTEKDAFALARDVDEIYAAKGKQVMHVDRRREKPDDATLKTLLLGPTGKLRAPTLRRGRTLLVGFDEATYRKILLPLPSTARGPNLT